MLRNKDIVVPVHVDTEVNIADFFTKILSAPRFKTLRDMFMISRKLDWTQFIEAPDDPHASRNS